MDPPAITAVLSTVSTSSSDPEHVCNGGVEVACVCDVSEHLQTTLETNQHGRYYRQQYIFFIK